MTDPATSLRVRVLLAMQRALWDMVTPELRGVAVNWTQRSVAARFLYDLDVVEPAEEIVAEAETYLLAELAPELDASFVAESVPEPQPRVLVDGESWVYLRREV